MAGVRESERQVSRTALIEKRNGADALKEASSGKPFSFTDVIDETETLQAYLGMVAFISTSDYGRAMQFYSRKRHPSG